MVTERLGVAAVATHGILWLLMGMPATFLAALTLAASLTAGFARSDDTRDLAHFFPGYTSALVVMDLSTGQATRHNPQMAGRAFSPCSTFKIPNSLVGLETGVIPGPDFVLAWDGTEYEIAAWNRDHDLRSAIASSVVWYYRELARRVGLERMQDYVARFGYGNQDLSGGVDRFWLGSTLRISADAQVAFLRRFETGELPVSPRSLGIVEEILLQPSAFGVVYRGKTGSCRNDDRSPDHGWWVGSVERAGRRHVFAGIIEGKGASGRVARPMVERALVELAVLPEPSPLGPRSPLEPALPPRPR